MARSGVELGIRMSGYWNYFYFYIVVDIQYIFINGIEKIYLIATYTN